MAIDFGPDFNELKREVNLPAHLIRLEAMLEQTISMLAQIIANQEHREFDDLIKKAFENVDKIAVDIFRNLPDPTKK